MMFVSVFAKHIAHLNPNLPTTNDYNGACSAIVRLHRVYKLKVADMFAGNYGGYIGPPLTSEDAFNVGKNAVFLYDLCCIEPGDMGKI